MKEDPPPDTRCRDKFLVQSVGITPANDTGTVSQIWSNIEQTAKSSIQEKKIRVNFLPADGTSSGGASEGAFAGAGAGAGGLGAGAATTNGMSHADEEPPAYSSPSPNMMTPQRSTPAPQAQTMTTPSESKTSRDTMVDSMHTAPEQSSTLAAVAAVIPGVSAEDLKRQLDSANTRVQQLQQQVTDGLRQRTSSKPAEGGEKSASMPSSSGLQQQMHAPNGVPVQIVALLCLLSFLIAWWFF